LGFVVWDLKDLGGKVPDLLVIGDGHCVPVEVKSPGQEHNFTIAEKMGIAECGDEGVEWVIAVIVKDVLDAFDIIREAHYLNQM